MYIFVCLILDMLFWYLLMCCNVLILNNDNVYFLIYVDCFKIKSIEKKVCEKIVYYIDISVLFFFEGYI